MQLLLLCFYSEVLRGKFNSFFGCVFVVFLGGGGLFFRGGGSPLHSPTP